MDILGNKRNYERSYWKRVADYLDRRGWHRVGNQFWDNSVAWANKWKHHDPEQGEAFPGSSTVFVSFMDGWHLVKLIWLLHLLATIVFYTPFTGHWLMDVLLLYLSFTIGHEVFWRVMLGLRRR